MVAVTDADSVYRCFRKASIEWRPVKYSELQAFTLAVQKIKDATGQLDEDNFWFRVISSLRRFRFEILAIPLSEKDLQRRSRELLLLLRDVQGAFGESFPNGSNDFAGLIASLESLSQTKMARLLTYVADELKNRKEQDQNSILVCETRFISDTENGLHSAGIYNVEVISPMMLRQDITFDSIMAIGPTRWFPYHVFAAPRSSDILIIKYAWIRDSWKFRNAFTHPLRQRKSKLLELEIDETRDESWIEAAAVLSTPFDLTRISQRMAKEIGAMGDEAEFVEARLFLLEEGWAVCLEAGENATQLVIDLDDQTNPLKRLKTTEIESGMYILLRTGGGGDFIVPIANQLMGEIGSRARESQVAWKKKLRTKIRTHGLAEAVGTLRKMGSQRANYQNLRNWMSTRTIKTELKEDFFAIMSYVGLDSRKEFYWNQMEIIDRAHRKAGFEIRRKLLGKVGETDLRKLKRMGKMDFQLEDEQDVGISAYLIREASKDAVKVPEARIGELIEAYEKVDAIGTLSMPSRSHGMSDDDLAAFFKR
jgi:hypothetical protein